MQNKLLKIARMGLALAVLVFAGALPAMAQDCEGWIEKDKDYWDNITPEQIKVCLDNGADVSVRGTSKSTTFYGYTPLHRVAINNANPKVISALVNAGANVNARDESGRAPIHNAAGWNKNPKVIMALLEAGANVNARFESGSTPLDLAVSFNGSSEIITALLDAGADVNARDERGKTPLHGAVSSNANYEIIAVLLDAGADVNAQDKRGKTPLIDATFWNNELALIQGRAVDETVQNKVKMIEILLDAGADLSAENFYYAVERQSPEVVTALLNAGADVNERVDGSTPLHKAAFWSKNPEMIMVLLKAGADGKAKNSSGKTAFALAKEHNKAIKGTDAYWALNDAQYE